MKKSSIRRLSHTIRALSPLTTTLKIKALADIQGYNRWKGKQPVVHTCSLVPSLLPRFSAGEGPGYEATHMFFSLNNKQQFFLLCEHSILQCLDRDCKKKKGIKITLSVGDPPHSVYLGKHDIFPSVLAYCKQFQTGQWDGLGTRLSTNTCWSTSYQ